MRLLFRLCVWTSTANALWPAPHRFLHGSSVVWLSSDVRMEYEPLRASMPLLQWLWDMAQLHPMLARSYPRIESGNNSGSFEKAQVPPATLLEDAFVRMKHEILHENIVPRKFHPKHSDFEPDINGASHPTVEVIIIRQVRSLRSPAFINGQAAEAFLISIGADGQTVIDITSVQGGLHALQTISQLFFAHSQSSTEVYSPYAPVSILDYPDFEHRGLNLDISRNWISPIDVMRTIEAMAATKLNYLHLHAADAQSWPLEIPALPELASKGAYDPGQTWTREDLEETQRHGLAHGVEVFLEIDLPGHTRAVGYAYPDLIVAADQEPWSDSALEPPAGQLKLNSSEVKQFLTTLLNDLLPRSSPWSSKFHIGGDELNTHVYSLDETVKSSSPAVLQPLLQAFVDHVISITQSHGIKPIVWENMLLGWNLTLPDTVTVQTWRSNSALNSVLAKGHRALFGSNSHWYLDCGLGSFLDPNLENPNFSEPDRVIKPPYLDSCSPFKNWRHIYSYNPLEGISQEYKHLIAGGEVHMWGELTDSITLDSTLWPRVAAAAEVMWSGAGKLADESTTRRLAEFRERLVARGVRAGMVQMEWCLRNEGKCTL